MSERPAPPSLIDQLLHSVEPPTRRGSHQAHLDAGTLAELEDFVAYLVKVEGKHENTARSYKSWCAKALVERGVHDSNVASAVQALARFRANHRSPRPA